MKGTSKVASTAASKAAVREEQELSSGVAGVRWWIGRRGLQLKTGKDFPAFGSENSIHLLYQASHNKQDRLALWVKERAAMVQALRGPHSNDRRSLDEARIAGMSYEAMLATLSELLALSSERKLTRWEEGRFGRAQVALKTLLRTQPRHIGKVKEHIAARGPLTSLLISALGEAGTEPAQEALRSIVDNKARPVEERLHVTRALSRVDTPSSVSVEALRSLKSDPSLGLQAVYGLGSNIYRLQSRNPELALSVARSCGLTSLLPEVQQKGAGC